MSQDLSGWIERQRRASAAGLLMSVSPHLTKTRPGFAQSVTARAGAVVASPVLASYDPDPDYFFHWFRDSALVVDALSLLRGDVEHGAAAEAAFGDFVRFSLELLKIDGTALADSVAWREAVKPDFSQFLRSAEELRQVQGLLVCADTRVNPDGTLDISRWARPQHDGPALRTLALLAWLSEGGLTADCRKDAVALLKSDLEFVDRFHSVPCFDIWEEEIGLHYYTLRVSAAALEGGFAWLGAHGELGEAAHCRQQARDILAVLDGLWREEGYYASRQLPDGRRSDKELDIAVLLASLHAKDQGIRHGVFDPRIEATFERLVELFAAEYPLNRAFPRDAPAMGRYRGDHYFSGGPFFFSTLGAAEYCYRHAAAGESGPWLERGDRFLEIVRRYTPEDGSLSEQFDRSSGAPSSARHLAWSYAAFLTCIAARQALQIT